MEKRTLAYDMAYIGYGTPGDGVPASEYTQLKIVDEETAVTFDFKDPRVINFRALGLKDPWASIVKAAEEADAFEFAIPSPTVEELKALAGGSVSGQKWEEPTTPFQVNYSWKFNTAKYEGKYVEFIITNGLTYCKPLSAPGPEKSELWLVRIEKQAAMTSLGEIKSGFSREIKSE